MEPRRSMTIGALLLCACGAASAQIYRCPDAAGRTVIQQQPCTGGTKMEVKPASGSDSALDAEAAKERAASNASEQQILIAIGKRQPAIGMSEANLRMAMGNPLRINRGNYSGRTRDQWIYERQDATWYVYVRDGFVSSFQSQQAIASGSVPAKRCPNSMEIRNMETSANSVTISPEERRVKRRQVAEAKACS